MARSAYNLVRPIAVRKIDVIGDDGKAVKQVEIKVGKPQQLEGSSDYECHYQIVGLGTGKIRRAVGVDGIQALLLAIGKIAADLYTSKESKAKRLRWSGNESGNLGVLAHLESLGDLVPEPRDTWVI